MLRKTFQHRLYPTKAQAEALQAQLAEACRLHNAALQERIEAYRTHRKSVSHVEQAAQLTEIRARGDFGLPNCHCAQDVLRRLDKAFQAFFLRALHAGA
jgi:putative transposase